jgi:MFS family permease
MAARRLPLVPTVALGLLSIVAFGAWFYGYGVLVEPIRTDTGWSEGLLGGTYGASLLVTGVAGTLVGHALDARGSRMTFVVLGFATTGVLLAASVAQDAWVFAGLGALGGGLVGAGGYYNATSAVMARLVPSERAHGITVLTLFGAFASPIFLPLIGWVVTRVGWRPTLRGLAIAVGVSYLLCAVGVPDVRPEEVERPPFVQALREAVAGRSRVAMVVAVMVAGATSALIIVQQVPAMTDAGMALATASAFAGARGLLQLVGRLPLAPVVVRFGARVTLRGSYALMGVGALLLIGAGDVVQASLYALVAGVGIGAMSAVESIYAADVYEGPSMGTHLGVLGMLRGVGGAVGPTLGGLAVDLTGSRTVTLVLSAAGALVAAGVLVRSSEPAHVPVRVGR